MNGRWLVMVLPFFVWSFPCSASLTVMSFLLPRLHHSFLILLSCHLSTLQSCHFVGLTLVGNSQFNLGKSWDKFKLKMKQGTWWTPITLWKEDTAHSSWMEELKSVAPMSTSHQPIINKNQREVDERRTCNLSHPHLIRWCKEKLNARRGLDQCT